MSGLTRRYCLVHITPVQFDHSPQRGRAMGEAGRQRVVPAFSAARLIADVDRLYRELLGAARR